MGLNVLMNPEGTVLYGTEEVTRRDGVERSLSNRQLFGGAELPHEYQSMPIGGLADGRWRELAPAGAGVAGQCGGDIQVTEAWDRRFALVRPDGTWAVATFIWYGVNKTTEYVGPDTKPEVVELQTELLIVEDPHDLDHHEWWDVNYITEYNTDPGEEGARRRAAAFTVADIDWNGER